MAWLVSEIKTVTGFTRHRTESVSHQTMLTILKVKKTTYEYMMSK